MTDTGEFHGTSTLAAIRSILKHPGVYYRYLRPLEVLTELLCAVELRTLGPDGLERSPFSLGQVINAVSTTSQAVERFAREIVGNAPLSVDPTTPLDSVLHLIAAEGFANALSDTVALDERAKVRPDDYANLLPTVQYSLLRLQRFQQLHIEIGRHVGCQVQSPPTIERAEIREALGYLADVRGYAPLVRAAMEDGAVVDAQVEPIDRLLDWLNGMHFAYARVEGTVRAFEGEFAMSVLVADYILGRCHTYLADYFQPNASYDDFRADERTPAHPFVLYWALEGLRPFRGTGEEAQSVGAVLRDAQREYYQLVAEAAGCPGEIDMIRLGYHLAIELEFNPGFHRDIALTAVGLLMANLQDDGTWAKRDRIWATPKWGDAYGLSVELLTCLLAAAKDEDEIEGRLEPALGKMIGWLDRHKTLPLGVANASLATGPFLWGPRLGAEARVPEAWATAECYSFLYLANRYNAQMSARLAVAALDGEMGGAPDAGQLLDMVGDIHPGNDAIEAVSIASTLIKGIVEPLETQSYFVPYGLSARADRSEKIRSGIFYGPPGAGKTTYVENLAKALGWPLIRLGPYHFLRNGTDRVPEAAKGVFAYLFELRDCVVLFDEMEELFRSRHTLHDEKRSTLEVLDEEAAREHCAGSKLQEQLNSGSDVEFRQRLWTTVFLPLFQDLHDRAHVLFFVATNYAQRLDSAIARPGRFDFVLQVIPPTKRAKIDGILTPRIKEIPHCTEQLAQEFAQWMHEEFESTERYLATVTTNGNEPGYQIVELDRKNRPPQTLELKPLTVQTIDGGLREAPMPVNVAFEYFTREDLLKLGNRVHREVVLLSRASPGAFDLTDLQQAFLRCFVQVVPAAYVWNPKRDELDASRLGWFQSSR
ncbi:MAG TPA: ATP-binding protein [Actinomycetota bacterium]